MSEEWLQSEKRIGPEEEIHPEEGMKPEEEIHPEEEMKPEECWEERYQTLCAARDAAWEVWHGYCMEWLDIWEGEP